MSEEKKLTGYPSIDKPWQKYQNYEAINMDLPICSMYDYIKQSPYADTSKPALIYYGRKISYRELFKNIELAAKSLAAIGINQGDVVTLCTALIPETIYTFYALNKLGAIANIIDPRTSTKGIHEYFVEAESTVILTLEDVISKVLDASKGLNVKKILVVSPAQSLPQLIKMAYRLKQTKVKYNDSRCMEWKEFTKLGFKKEDVPSPTYIPNRPAVIVHTGGTTGTPKGVVLSDDGLNSSAKQVYLSGLNFKPEHTWLDFMPPFIAYGIGNGLHLPLSIGMTVKIIPQFNADLFDQLLLKNKANHLIGVPLHWDILMKNTKGKKLDLSFLIQPIVGSDHMSIGLEQEVNEFLAAHGCKDKVLKGYGMTETCAAACVCTGNDCNKLGSVGVPFGCTIISAFDINTGEELPCGQTGEICITGPSIMLEYYKNKKETELVLRKHSDGKIWVHSGDSGHIDKDGFVFIDGRMKRMIIRYEGFKIFPSVIENVISNHESVENCSVVGINDAEHRQGQYPIAHVILKPNARSNKKQIEHELIELCQQELPEYAYPIGYIFREKMPQTPVSKIDYRALEKEAEQLQ